MKKIISLFKRDYDGDRLAYDEVVPGAEWVTNGEGVATVKYDGTCCMIRDDKRYKRYDRKLTKANARRLKNSPTYVPMVEDYKPAPDGWEPAEPAPNQHTGHWPGWLPVGDGPEDQWHREAWEMSNDGRLGDGTFELVGPKVQGNPYSLDTHQLWRHGQEIKPEEGLPYPVPRDFDGLKEFFERVCIEGIVWHHPDGRMVKVKRRDFGYEWPVKNHE